MSFTATYRGVCVECPELIEPGQEIESVGLTDYRHVTCPEPRPIPSIELARGEVPCPACHLVYKGECF